MQVSAPGYFFCSTDNICLAAFFSDFSSLRLKLEPFPPSALILAAAIFSSDLLSYRYIQPLSSAFDPPSSRNLKTIGDKANENVTLFASFTGAHEPNSNSSKSLNLNLYSWPLTDTETN